MAVAALKEVGLQLMYLNKVKLLEINNHAAIARALDEINISGLQQGPVLLLSPSFADYKFVKSIFKNVEILTIFQDLWDLNQTPPKWLPHFGLSIASNVMMYSTNIDSWVTNICSISNLFIFQDLIYRKRDNLSPYLGNDGDSKRFELLMRSDGEVLGVEGIVSSNWVHGFEFQGITNEHHQYGDFPRHFVAVYTVQKPKVVDKIPILVSIRLNFYVSKTIAKLKKLI